MKTTMAKWGTRVAGASAVALLLATPSFAQSRGDWNRNGGDRGRQTIDSRGGNDRAYENGYRENQRVTMQGQIRSFNRERDGYRVQLDRGNQSFWVPQSTFGNRARDIRAGVSISLGGIFRGGTVYVDAVSWPDQGYGYGNGYGYENGFVRGMVERVDFRSGMVWLRDDNSGRLITADLNGGHRYGSALRNLRRGDYVELTGQWVRNGLFDVARVDNVRNRRR